MKNRHVITFFVVSTLFTNAQQSHCSQDPLVELAQGVSRELCKMGSEVTGEYARSQFFRPRPSFTEGTLTSTVTAAALLAAGKYAFETQFENPSRKKSALCNGIASIAMPLGAAATLCALNQVAPTDFATIAPTCAKNLPYIVAGYFVFLQASSSVRFFLMRCGLL